jgi:hypothetical protein
MNQTKSSTSKKIVVKGKNKDLPAALPCSRFYH